MKAIQISQTGSFEVLEYVDVDTPTPGRGQVLVKVESISVNFTDVMLRKGIHPMVPPLPTIPGLDFSGVVESVGEGVTQVRPGQNVVVIGKKCYTEYALASAGSVVLTPEGIDMDAAAALPVNYLTAYHMLHTMGHVEAGQTILAYAAAGGVGTAIIQLAKLAGVTVIGLTSSDGKARYTKEQGIDHIINYKTENVTQRVKEVTDGKGVNLILDSVAGEAFNRNFEMLAPLGQIIWFGMAAGVPPENLVEQFASNFEKGAGVRVFHLLYSVAEPYPDLMAQSIETMVKYLTEKKIEPHIHERIPLSDAARAHEMLENRIVTGKLILKP